MTIPAIAPLATYVVPPASAASSAADAASKVGSGSDGYSDLLDPQSFLKLLVAQLQYQDPTSPTDMTTFMAQTATLAQTQAINAMQQSLQSLLTVEQAQSAITMIGKEVTYTDASGASATGVVTGATSLATGTHVQIGSLNIPLGNVISVSTAPDASV